MHAIGRYATTRTRWLSSGAWPTIVMWYVPGFDTVIVLPTPTAATASLPPSWSKSSSRSTVAGAANRGVRGAGLGLAVSRGIVEGHGGEIWGEAGAGRTTTFVVSLLLSRDAAASRR